MAIITISRQVGSFGDEIGTLAAEKLGYELISRELIHQEAQACDLDFKKACQAYEEETKPGGFFERLFFGEPAYTPLFESMNYDLAMRGNVVMLGRGANFALAPVPGVLKVRVVAPAELRAKRIARKKGVPMDEAASFVERYGHRRRALIESIYQKNLSDWANYDLIINTGDFSAEDGAGIVIAAAGGRQAAVDEASQRKILEDLAFAKRVERAVKKEITTLTYRDVMVEVGQGGQNHPLRPGLRPAKQGQGRRDSGRGGGSDQRRQPASDHRAELLETRRQTCPQEAPGRVFENPGRSFRVEMSRNKLTTPGKASRPERRTGLGAAGPLELELPAARHCRLLVNPALPRPFCGKNE